MFPEKYSVLVVGAPNAGVLEFCAYLTSFYLNGNQSVVLVESDTSRAFVRRQLRNFGIKHDEYEGNQLVLLDCYSAPSESDDADYTCDPSDLPDLLQKIMNVAQPLEEPVRIIFDSLSSLHIYSNPAQVRDFLKRLSDFAKKKGSLTATLHENMHSIDQVNALIDLCDGLIEMHIDDKLKRFIRISRMKSIDVEPKWVPFEIEPAENVAGTALVWKKD